VASSDVKASFLQRVCSALYEPVDISFLVFFRIVFGIMLWEAIATSVAAGSLVISLHLLSILLTTDSVG
jgi:hypothetical protein